MFEPVAPEYLTRKVGGPHLQYNNFSKTSFISPGSSLGKVLIIEEIPDQGGGAQNDGLKRPGMQAKKFSFLGRGTLLFF